jgi:hypothetical protein
VEMSHFSDIENGLQLLVKFLESLEKDPIRFGKIYK